MIEKIESYIKKKGIKEYEIFYESSEKTRMILQRDNIDFLSKGYVDGIGIRVCIDKKLGFSSTIDIKNYEKCVDEAIKISKLNCLAAFLASFLNLKLLITPPPKIICFGR